MIYDLEIGSNPNSVLPGLYSIGFVLSRLQPHLIDLREEFLELHHVHLLVLSLLLERAHELEWAEGD